MKCPICGSEMYPETYYDEEYEDTAYCYICEECGYDDRCEDEDNYDEFERQVIFGEHPFLEPWDI